MNRPLILAACAALALAAPAAFAHGHGSGDQPDPAAPAAETPPAAMPHQQADADAHEDRWQIGPLTVSAPYSRATLPNAPVAGGFLTIRNAGDAEDRLIGAASDVAASVEIHEMTMNGDVMTMRQRADGLAIPAGETVQLSPGGLHLMFLDLRQPLVEGDSVDVTLTFESAGPITVPLSVQAFNARGAGHGDASADPHAGH